MIDFLKYCNISKETIDKLYAQIDEPILFSLDSNRDECAKIIEILRRIGIDNHTIENILLSRIDVFFMSSDEFIDKIKKIGISNFIDTVNNDWIDIDILFED